MKKLFYLFTPKKGQYIFLLTFISFLFLIEYNSVAQQLTQGISYQGKLIENGRPFTGSQTILFELIENGGNIRWSETQTVSIQDGLYSVYLGSQTPLPSSVFAITPNLSLRVTINGNVLSPNVPLRATPYAHVSGGVLRNSIGTLQIIDGSVSSIDLADNSVTTTKIANDAVTSSKILNGSILLQDLGINSVDSTKVINGSINSNDIADGTINRLDLAINSVDSTKVINGSINSNDIANGTINDLDLADNAVTTSKILNETILNEDVNANAAIEGTKVSPNFGSQDILTTGDIKADSLTLTGNAFITGYLEIDDDLEVVGDAEIDGDLEVNSDAGIAGNLEILGKATSAQTVGGDGDDILTTKLYVDNQVSTATQVDGITIDLNGSSELEVVDNGITTGKILDGTITNSDISATAAINSTKLDNNSITINTGAGLIGGGNVALGNALTLSAIDASTTNELQDLTLATDILSITNDPTPTNTINLTPYRQNLFMSGNQIQISGGGSANLSFTTPTTNGQVLTWNQTNNRWDAQTPTTFTNTDNQTLSLATSTVATRDISITGGNTLTLNIQDADASTTNELQDLNLTSNNLTITGGTLPTTSIDLTPYKQNLSLGTGSATTRDINISDGTGVSINIQDADASPTNELQSLSIVGNLVGITGGGSGFNLTPSPPVTNQVLTWNGSAWVGQTLPAGTPYTGGLGINVSGTVISNAAPDQTVSLIGGGSTTITGTYPNFTISSTGGSTYTAGNGLTLGSNQFSLGGTIATTALTRGTGTAIPHPKLFSIIERSASTDYTLYVEGGTTSDDLLYLKSKNAATSYHIINVENSVGTSAMFLFDDGRLQAVNYSNISDIRLKKKVNSLNNSLLNIQRLRGTSYFWKDASLDQNLQFGVIAQEVEEVFPNLVHTDNEGYKSVNYIGIVPVLIEATKEQQTIIEAQEEKISKLEIQVQELKELVLFLKDENDSNSTLSKKVDALEKQLTSLVNQLSELTAQK